MVAVAIHVTLWICVTLKVAVLCSPVGFVTLFIAITVALMGFAARQVAVLNCYTKDFHLL